MTTLPEDLQATYLWALRQSRRNAERAFLEYLVTVREHGGKVPPAQFDDINKVICIALTGRTPRDLLDSVDPDWLTTPREKLTEAIKAHLASQDWPSSPFDDELAFGSDEADRNIASVAQQWVSAAAFQVAMQEGAPREIIDAMEAMRLRVGWGVMQPEPSDRPQLIDGIYEGYRLSIRRGYPYDERPAWIDLETSEDA